MLLSVPYLNLIDSFIAFYKQKLIQLTRLSKEFSLIELMVLNYQLGTYIIDVWSNRQFFDLKGISNLAKKWLREKENYVSTYFFTCYIGLDSAICNYDYGDKIFDYEYYEKYV